MEATYQPVEDVASEVIGSLTGEAGSHLSYKHVRKSIVFEFLFYWKTQGPFLPEYFSLH